MVLASCVIELYEQYRWVVTRALESEYLCGRNVVVSESEGGSVARAVDIAVMTVNAG